MIIFPAIDLKDGQCVRLLKGEMDQATVFNENPVDQAKLFESQGFEWIHIVDLNGAFSGQSEHTDIIKDIIQHTSIPIQLGGGIRHMDAIDHWLDTGLSRVILGTVALRDPDLVIEACKRHPGKIAVGIDGKDGYVAVEGWAETSEISVIELAKKFEEAGVSAIIYTDINRDGLLCGPDIEGTKTLAQSLSIPVIASGGVSSNDDIHAIKNLEHDGVCGVIVGRALYDGRIDITHALSTSKSTT